MCILSPTAEPFPAGPRDEPEFHGPLRRGEAALTRVARRGPLSFGGRRIFHYGTGPNLASTCWMPRERALGESLGSNQVVRDRT